MMEFADNKPIYLQVTDFCRRQILDGKWVTHGRIPSTKELAVELAVNHRTVMKAYDDMNSAGVVYQKRGLGYFVAPDAIEAIHRQMRAEFMATTLPDFLAAMRMAGLTPADVIPLIR
ncbi:MAG: GntR family transcriptional regulator [Muribaculaceae bacterium]|nr:GntR family transcriptional regulator [Muribaculaceae bacterium]